MCLTSLLQDRHGFLWIGTLDGGLVRYDGRRFNAFKHNPFKKKGPILSESV
ncbi:MAG: hypothetical protein GY809_03505 [Planctomycetes bacterium]|nr:hypothetical protein [Planctomycetota bacterium]